MAPNSPGLAQDAPTTAPRHPNVYMYKVSLRRYDGMKGIVYPYHTCVLHVQKPKLTSMPCNDGSDDARLLPLLIILMVGQEDEDADDKLFGATELPDLSLQHF